MLIYKNVTYHSAWFTQPILTQLGFIHLDLAQSTCTQLYFTQPIFLLSLVYLTYLLLRLFYSAYLHSVWLHSFWFHSSVFCLGTDQSVAILKYLPVLQFSCYLCT